MDYRVHGVAKSRTRLSEFQFHFHVCFVVFALFSATQQGLYSGHAIDAQRQEEERGSQWGQRLREELPDLGPHREGERSQALRVPCLAMGKQYFFLQPEVRHHPLEQDQDRDGQVGALLPRPPLPWLGPFSALIKTHLSA